MGISRRPSGSTGSIYGSLAGGECSYASAPQPTLMPSSSVSYAASYPSSMPRDNGCCSPLMRSSDSTPFFQPQAVSVPPYSQSSVSYPSSTPNDEDCCRTMCRIL
jgi:hypothetical protein